ncbi:unnamed protein product [Heterobilharzia americana]|nr:unnamed protein product [Heterobilharzia americana]
MVPFPFLFNIKTTLKDILEQVQIQSVDVIKIVRRVEEDKMTVVSISHNKILMKKKDECYINLSANSIGLL